MTGPLQLSFLAVWNWLVDNRTWVFDGFGVAIAAGLIGMFWKRRKRDGAGQTIRTGDRSVNVQAGRDAGIASASQHVVVNVAQPDEAGTFAVREWVRVAKENDQRARELEAQLARARVSGEKMIANSDEMGASIAELVASNKGLAKVMQDNLKLAEDLRDYNKELGDRYDAAWRTISNMHLALSDETPELDLARDRDRIILARLYAYQFHEALDFYLTAAEAGGPWPKLYPEVAARFRAIPAFGKPPQLLSTVPDAATKKRLRHRLAKLAKTKPSAPNPSSGPDSEEPPSS
jgi:hypothetical protein